MPVEGSPLYIGVPDPPQECGSINIDWSGGTPPYDVAAFASSTPLASFRGINGSPIQWTVNASTGTPITFTVEDSMMHNASTGSLTVSPGSTTSCLLAPPPESSLQRESRYTQDDMTVVVIVLASLANVLALAAIGFWIRLRRTKEQILEANEDIHEHKEVMTSPEQLGESLL